MDFDERGLQALRVLHPSFYEGCRDGYLNIWFGIQMEVQKAFGQMCWVAFEHDLVESLLTWKEPYGKGDLREGFVKLFQASKGEQALWKLWFEQRIFGRSQGKMEIEETVFPVTEMTEPYFTYMLKGEGREQKVVLLPSYRPVLFLEEK